MRSLTVGVYQCAPRPGAVDHNLARFEAALRRAPLSEADLVVAPEMFATGWSGAPRDPLKGLAARFEAIAHEHSIALATSLATFRRGREFNTFHLWDDGGRLLGTQDKVHLWADEARRRSPGLSVRPIRTRWGLVGGLVCYDVEFPELARSLAVEGAELFLVPSAFYSSRSWDIMTRARALENGCFLAAANQIGVNPKNPHNGGSRIVDPFGRVAARVAGGSRAASTRLDPTLVHEARAWAPFLRDRRLDFDGERPPRAPDGDGAPKARIPSRPRRFL